LRLALIQLKADTDMIYWFTSCYDLWKWWYL